MVCVQPAWVTPLELRKCVKTGNMATVTLLGKKRSPPSQEKSSYRAASSASRPSRGRRWGSSQPNFLLHYPMVVVVIITSAHTQRRLRLRLRVTESQTHKKKKTAKQSHPRKKALTLGRVNRPLTHHHPPTHTHSLALSHVFARVSL